LDSEKISNKTIDTLQDILQSIIEWIVCFDIFIFCYIINGFYTQ
jgi:uncharacterized membrane protein (DUF373 family)